MQKGQKVKTKVRFTSLDVAAMVQNMQALIGMRATNIYDLNPSTYLIKLNRSEEKSYLLIENGVRFHTTEERPDKKALPSGFTMKFRKYLRSKRLEAIRQVGVERVVVFTFGSQSFVNHLVIELYAQGNIILTDQDYRILQCIRSHEFNEKVKTAVGQIYPFEYAANIYLENLEVNAGKVDAIFDKDEKQEDQANQKEQDNKNKGKKGSKKGPIKLRDTVQKLLPCLFPLVIDHILLSNNKNPDEKVSKQNKDFVIECGQICLSFLKSYLQSKHKGYLFYKQQNQVKEQKSKEGKEVDYFEFSSYKNAKYSNQLCKQFPTFDESVKVYFQNYKKNQHEEEQNIEGIAWKKYDQIKKDQDERVRKLQEEQDIYKLKAEYIQKNIADVDAIIKIIKTMEDNGYSWDDISRMVSESKKNGDPLANMIHELTILKRQVTILLGDPSSEEQMFELLPVEINIDYNAYTNATMYYESKKKNYQKEQRTKQASQQVLKLAEKEALKKIEKKKNEVFSKNLPQRKVFWFEKFCWFISSQGYLVISGRDSHQNELIVKRYMKSGDLYMHSDYGGAASTVIKSHRKEVAVPLNTLEEAAIFTVCRSKAWQTKIISGAWWVYPEQVSKSAPTGEFLPTGSFMIRGKRNFIYPNRMQMGMTLLFKVDNDSAQRHFNDRRIHEEETKKESEQPQKFVMNTEEKEQEEFAIVSIDMQTRKEKIEQKNRQKEALKKQASTKIQELKNVTTQKDSDASDDESDEEEKEIKLAKKPSQTNKNSKPSAKKEQENNQNQQKHKQRNKKKLKKLQKYLQEQDEDERQIIMKMIGAKQMKHMKDPSELAEEKTKNTNEGKSKKKKDKKDVKKGINKYIDFEQNDEEKKEKLNPDKVLFLKDKKKQEEDEKKLMENSQSSDDQTENDKQKQTNSQTKVVNQSEVPTQNATETQENQIEDQNEKQDKEEESDNQNEVEQQPVEETKEEPQELVDEKILDSELGELYKLVGNLHPEDKPEFFVPMCAPYNAIKENRFKIKLVPGGLKKGKAARNIIQYFQSLDLTEKQKPMLRALPEQDMINAVIGNVKLAGAGLLKMEMKEKQEKKMKRKEQDKKKETVNNE